MSITGQISRASSPIEKSLAAIMQHALRCANGAWRYDVRIILVALFLMGSLGVAPVVGQDTPAASQPTPGPLDLPPSPRKQILTPIPSQFEWMNREAPAPLLLETRLGPRETHNLDASQQLLDQKSIGSTAASLGGEPRQALDVPENPGVTLFVRVGM